METKTLSKAALHIIDQYLHFRIGNAVASVPYFNNKTVKARMTLRAKVGKGSPDDIKDELQSIIVKQHIAPTALADEALKKLLVDNGLGVDCSGFAYYILDAESKATGNGHLNRRIHFINSYGPIGKMMCYLRPAENCNVKTLASDNNTSVVALKDARPGDIITMLGSSDAADRDHVLLITDISLENGSLRSLSYIHAIAYPEDGRYGTGPRQGKIDISFPGEPLLKQVWSEGAALENARRLYERAAVSRTEIRRLKWLT